VSEKKQLTQAEAWLSGINEESDVDIRGFVKLVKQDPNFLSKLKPDDIKLIKNHIYQELPPQLEPELEDILSGDDAEKWDKWLGIVEANMEFFDDEVEAGYEDDESNEVVADSSEESTAPESLTKEEVMTEVDQLIIDAGELINLLETLKNNVGSLDGDQARDELGEAQSTLTKITIAKGAIFGKIRQLDGLSQEKQQVRQEVKQIFADELDEPLGLIQTMLAEISTSVGAEPTEPEADPAPAEKSALEVQQGLFEAKKAEIEAATNKIDAYVSEINQQVTLDGSNASSPVPARIDRAVRVYKELVGLEELGKMAGFDKSLGKILDYIDKLVIPVKQEDFEAKEALEAQVGAMRDKVVDAQSIAKDLALRIWKDGYKLLCPELDERDGSAINTGPNKSFAHQLKELGDKAPDFVGMSQDQLIIARRNLKTEVISARQSMALVAKNRLNISSAELTEINDWFDQGIGAELDRVISGLDELIEKMRARTTITPGNTPRVVNESPSVIVDQYRKKPLEELLKDWYTADIDKEGEGRASFDKVRDEKIEKLKEEFVSHSASKGEGETEALERWESFRDLYIQLYALIDYGGIRYDSQNVDQLTAVHDVALEAAAKSGAMSWNTKFNNNDLVKSLDVSLGEQFSAGMGLIQKMVFVAFQEMKKKSPYNEDEKRQIASLPFGMATISTYSRNQSFTESLVDKLFTEVSEVRDIKTLAGAEIHVGIKDELDMYPDEAKKVIIQAAKWKCSRDDLGSKAGIWHEGKNKGAFKYADGASGRPAGVLAGILYQVGKNTARENHAALLGFIDPTETEFMEEGRPADRNLWGNYKQWDRQAIHNREVVRFAEENERFTIWSHPQWRNVTFEKYQPQHWYEDFPALDVFFNQGDGAKGSKDYMKTRDAVLKILELAADAPNIALSSITDQMREKIIVLVKTFSTEIGKAIAYIDAYEQGNPNNYVHRMIGCAFQYYLANILMAVPGNIGLSSVIPGIKILHNSGVINQEYNELYQIALRTIESTINQNTTLKNHYWSITTGKDDDANRAPFLFRKEFRRVWRDENRLRNQFMQWRVDNSPEHSGIGRLKKARTLSGRPQTPTNVKEGWKSSYEDQLTQQT
jgi:hypothetical protein